MSSGTADPAVALPILPTDILDMGAVEAIDKAVPAFGKSLDTDITMIFFQGIILATSAGVAGKALAGISIGSAAIISYQALNRH